MRRAAWSLRRLARCRRGGAAGCDTSPLYPDMRAGDLSTPIGVDVGDLGGAAADAPAPPPPDASLPGRTLVWSDEFDGAAGASPDATKWSFDVGGSGWGNSELEYTTARPENVALDGAGHLAITARAEAYMGKSYTSGRINTLAHFTRAYGRFEARMQLPAGQGMWPAFWLLGNNVSTVGWPACGEIDIIENKGQEPNTVHGTVHGPGYSGGNGITAMRARARARRCRPASTSTPSSGSPTSSSSPSTATATSR